MFLVFVNGVVLCSYEDEWFGEVHTFIKGSKVTWVPNGDKLTTSAPGVVLSSYEDEWFGEVRIFIFRLTLCRYG